MKTAKSLSALILLLLLISCGTPKEETKAQDEALVEWKELDSFHMLMAEAFHPLKDSGNVEPATRMMEQLANEAEKWAAAPLPEKVNTDDMKAKLEKLKTDTRALAEEIKIGTEDDVIGTRLYDIHDLFHQIQEAWYKKGDAEGDHKDHH